MSAPAAWREPASLLPLHWGSYRARLLTGLAMLVVGTACVLGTTAYSLPLLLIGSVLQPAGWAVLPSTVGRRVAVPLPVLGFTWLMLGGSEFSWCYCITLAAWLLVRLRPLPSFAVLVLPVVSSLVLAGTVTTYEQGWITILVSTLTIVAAAWLARLIAIRWDSWQSVRTLRKEPSRLDQRDPQ
ncbi:hypothetical protein [Leifsonia sp. AG29]|uniref:hypothetical protein n=1 Tax=Leifsonia sp. AG29 TaxID=2598860 RepID=UPI001E36B1EF|nr:hypothetical protein [Leifsonia sp. AG29]